MQQSPRRQGLERSRWWLGGLKQALTFFADVSVVTVWKWLIRMGLRYKRGQVYLHSPDPLYDAKVAAIEAAQQDACDNPQESVFLYQDEVTYYRRPSVDRCWAPAGDPQPQAHLGHSSNTKRRIAAVVDVADGRVVYWQRSSFRVKTLIAFFKAVGKAYPDAKRIYIAYDNWPVHFHPDVLDALQDTSIRLLPLPTYAPWLNPIEKLWRLLKQHVLHLHDFDDNWQGLVDTVDTWMRQWEQPSSQIVSALGL